MDLPSLNAGLNLLAALLLVRGRQLVRAGRVEAHRAHMVAALVASTLFLAGYLVHHARVGSVRFRGEGLVRTAYLAILLTHTVLAALVPPLALRTLWLGLKDRRSEHLWWARLAWPIWIYVSATGVVIYLMLYRGPW